jgi:hypothetical protein
MPKDKSEKDKKSSKSKDKSEKDAKSSKSKDKDAKSSKSKSKDKDAKSSKSKDKADKSSKSKDKDKKSSKSGKSTPSKDKKSEKGGKSSKSVKSGKEGKSKGKDASNDVSNADIASQLDAEILSKANTVDPNTQVHFGQGTMDGFGTVGASESPFGRFQNPYVTVAKICMLHNKPLVYFCDTCEELLCSDCTTMGPHNTQLHRICNLEEAFRYRFEMINKAIYTSIMPKRQQLIGQIVRLDRRLDEIKTVKGVIERDIRNEYAAIMERLRSAEGVKSAVLQHDIAEIQKDITRIDQCLDFVSDVSA